MPSKTFCALPWIFQAVRNNGMYRVCCQANQGPERGLMKDALGLPMRADTHSIEQARNAALAKEIRKAMLEGRWHAECIRCKKEEDSGLQSRRIVENRIWRETLADHLDVATKATSEDGTLDLQKAPPVYFDIRFGNKCNLKCRSCGPTDSSAWYDDYVKLWGLKSYEDAFMQVNLVEDRSGRFNPQNSLYEWYETERFWSDLLQYGDRLKHLHIVGGEPLLIQQHFDFLETCVNRGYSSQIIIEYNSNVTVLPQRALDLWKHFRMVKIGASLDGVEGVNDYIRFPSRWSQIETNLRKLDQVEGPFRLWIAHTVMALNIVSLPETLAWRFKSNFKRIQSSTDLPTLTTHPLHSPHFLNVKVFPEQVKSRIADALLAKWPLVETAIREAEYDEAFKRSSLEKSRTLIEHFIRFMKSEDYSHLFNKFLFHTRKLDEIRGQRLSESLPELSSILQQCGYSA
ncbi:MAG: twitch domain-containing radical SAM protein [Bdellovibrionales bacterium]